MTEETALEPTTLVTVAEAVAELQEHSFASFIRSDAIVAYDGDRWSVVAKIVAGQVSSADVMIWLGY